MKISNELRKFLNEKLIVALSIALFYYIGSLVSNQLDLFFVHNNDGLSLFTSLLVNTIIGVMITFTMSMITLLSLGGIEYLKENITLIEAK